MSRYAFHKLSYTSDESSGSKPRKPSFNNQVPVTDLKLSVKRCRKHVCFLSEEQRGI